MARFPRSSMNSAPTCMHIACDGSVDIGVARFLAINFLLLRVCNSKSSWCNDAFSFCTTILSCCRCCRCSSSSFNACFRRDKRVLAKYCIAANTTSVVNNNIIPLIRNGLHICGSKGSSAVTGTSLVVAMAVVAESLFMDAGDVLVDAILVVSVVVVAIVVDLGG
jgi:hypothetical protein